MSKQILQFKITLNDIHPKIWRRIQVPSDYTFWDLHCAIQNAMAWMNCHLHGYFMTSNKYSRNRPLRVQMPNPGWDFEDDINESKELLVTWFPDRLKQCVYTYDFGDTWDHTVLFEKGIAIDGGKYPVCIAGENACPPEDCGGPPGYEDLLSALKKPRTKQGQYLREWMGLEKGEIYDSTAFNVTEVAFDHPKKLLKEYLRDQKLYG